MKEEEEWAAKLAADAEVFAYHNFSHNNTPKVNMYIHFRRLPRKN